MTERTRAANEEIADRRSMEVPDEDHEWQGQAAWGTGPDQHRDAILQPPPPQIPPAAEVAERAGRDGRGVWRMTVGPGILGAGAPHYAEVSG